MQIIKVKNKNVGFVSGSTFFKRAKESKKGASGVIARAVKRFT